MKPGEYQENTIYLRKAPGDTWECMAKVKGRGLMLQNLPSRELAIRSMTFLIWGMNTFPIETYGSEMEKLEGAPDGVEYPVVEESARV